MLNGGVVASLFTFPDGLLIFFTVLKKKKPLYNLMSSCRVEGLMSMNFSILNGYQIP